MNSKLVEIQPRELKFFFELKRQSSCAVHLTNTSDQYVAFKVKTTSPKKYCVRPNVGIIKPKSTCDFIVTMQAQKSAPSDMQCNDKFLIQSTVVPFGTTEDEITPAMFAKDSQKYIEETKLRVVLATAPNSPAKPAADVVSKQEALSYETVSPKEPFSPVSQPANGFHKQEESHDMSIPKDELQNGVVNLSSTDLANEKLEAIENVENMEETRSFNVMNSVKSVPVKHEVLFSEMDEESKKAKDVEEIKFNPTQEIEELRLKISVMDAKLVEAQRTIEMLKKEKGSIVYEKERLKQKLAMSQTSSSSGVARKHYVGFPPLFVFMVALISLMLGLFFRV